MKMLRILGAVCLLLASGSASLRAQGLNLGSKTADIARVPRCQHCGMDRSQFSHTRHLLVYADGSEVGTCSIHCLALEMIQLPRRSIRSVHAGDAGFPGEDEPLHPVASLTYILDPSRRGTMTARRKWAFSSKAKAYQDKGEGKLIDFETALAKALEDLAPMALSKIETKGRRR